MFVKFRAIILRLFAADVFRLNACTLLDEISNVAVGVVLLSPTILPVPLKKTSFALSRYKLPSIVAFELISKVAAFSCWFTVKLFDIIPFPPIWRSPSIVKTLKNASLMVNVSATMEWTVMLLFFSNLFVPPYFRNDIIYTNNLFFIMVINGFLLFLR